MYFQWSCEPERFSFLFWENSHLLFYSIFMVSMWLSKISRFHIGLEDDFIEYKLNIEMDLFIEMVSIVQRVPLLFLIFVTC